MITNERGGTQSGPGGANPSVGSSDHIIMDHRRLEKGQMEGEYAGSSMGFGGRAIRDGVSGYPGSEEPELETPTKQYSGSLRDDTPEKYTRGVDIPSRKSDGTTSESGGSQGRSGDMPAGWGGGTRQGGSQGRESAVTEEARNSASSNEARFGKKIYKSKTEPDGVRGIASGGDATTMAGDTPVKKVSR